MKAFMLQMGIALGCMLVGSPPQGIEHGHTVAEKGAKVTRLSGVTFWLPSL